MIWMRMSQSILYSGKFLVFARVWEPPRDGAVLLYRLIVSRSFMGKWCKTGVLLNGIGVKVILGKYQTIIKKENIDSIFYIYYF